MICSVMLVSLLEKGEAIPEPDYSYIAASILVGLCLYCLLSYLIYVAIIQW